MSRWGVFTRSRSFALQNSVSKSQGDLPMILNLFPTASGWSRVFLYAVPQPKRKKDTFWCPSFWALFANDNDGIRTYFQLQAVGVGFLCTMCPSQNEKRTPFGVLRFGWGTGIRTPVMTESESVALPLGDAPIFSTLCIITEKNRFVNTYFQLF